MIDESERSEALRGEAPRTLFAEGVLNPNNCKRSDEQGGSADLFAEGLLKPNDRRKRAERSDEQGGSADLFAEVLNPGGSRASAAQR